MEPSTLLLLAIGTIVALVLPSTYFEYLVTKIRRQLRDGHERAAISERNWYPTA